MITRQLFLLFIAFNALSIYNCFGMEKTALLNGMEKEDKIITLDKGLLTIIPAKITTRNYKTESFFGQTTSFETFNERNDTVTNLWRNNEFYTNNKWNYFRPLIIKIKMQQQTRFIQNLGRLDKKSHGEAKEAIREKQALYYTRKEGVLVYSLDEQPDHSIIQHINRMLDDNKWKMTIPQ
jgi:hypothetical protein